MVAIGLTAVPAYADEPDKSHQGPLVLPGWTDFIVNSETPGDRRKGCKRERISSIDLQTCTVCRETAKMLPCIEVTIDGSHLFAVSVELPNDEKRIKEVVGSLARSWGDADGLTKTDMMEDGCWVRGDTEAHVAARFFKADPKHKDRFVKVAKPTVVITVGRATGVCSK